MTLTRKYTNLDNGVISYLERPGDKPMVFLHGVGGLGNNWMKLIGLIPKDFRIILPDLPGHGKSTLRLEGWSIRDQVAALRNFFIKEGIEKPILIGNSYGGWIATAYCIHFGDIEALILIDSAGINKTIGEDGDERINGFLERVMREYPSNNREIISKILENNSRETEKIKSTDLQGITCPTLIIWGKKDKIIPSEYGITIADNIRGSLFRLIEEAGHIPHYTNSEETTSIILEFLANAHLSGKA